MEVFYVTPLFCQKSIDKLWEIIISAIAATSTSMSCINYKQFLNCYDLPNDIAIEYY